MAKEISFILGAGFSVAANFPTAKLLGEKLMKSESEPIAFYNEKLVVGTNGKKPEIGFNAPYEEAFHYGVRLMAFYMKTHTDFQYEDFYDYLTDLCHKAEKRESIDIEVPDMLPKQYVTGDKMMDIHTHTRYFIHVYEELISYFLDMKKDVDLRPYAKFADFLRRALLEGCKINIYTLNHDVLLEKIIDSFGLQSVFTDGFSAVGSPYYTIAKDEKILLERFTNQYDKPICLHKLHGSVNYHMFSEEVDAAYFKNSCFVKEPTDIDDWKLYVEDKGTSLRKGLFGYNSEFLSGTNTKVTRYHSSIYYQPQFANFVSDLQKTEELIVIGYGYGDTEINSIVRANISPDARCTNLDPYLRSEAEKIARSIMPNYQLLRIGVDQIK